MEHLCAKQYSLREVGLGLVRSWLEEGGRAGGQQQQQQPTRRGGQSSTVRAAVQVLRRALRDQVISVREERDLIITGALLISERVF